MDTCFFWSILEILRTTRRNTVTRQIEMTGLEKGKDGKSIVRFCHPEPEGRTVRRGWREEPWDELNLQQAQLQLSPLVWLCQGHILPSGRGRDPRREMSFVTEHVTLALYTLEDVDSVNS